MIMTKTLEKVAGKYATDMGGDFHQGIYNAFIKGVKWQQERSYSDEEVWKLVNKLNQTLNIGSDLTLEEWFEQFKKK